jgi:tyrosyl-tRNA synthetase
MNDVLITQILTILSTMKSNDCWSRAHDDAYYIGLSDLPESIADALRKAILVRFEWRPSVKEIRELAQEILHPRHTRTAAGIVAELYELRDKYGAYAVCHSEQLRVWKKGEPHWSDPVKRKVIAAVGGWVSFCEDAAASGVMRGQLLKIAEQVLRDNDIQEIRLSVNLNGKNDNVLLEMLGGQDGYRDENC